MLALLLYSRKKHIHTFKKHAHVYKSNLREVELNDVVLTNNIIVALMVYRWERKLMYSLKHTKTRPASTCQNRSLLGNIMSLWAFLTLTSRSLNLPVILSGRKCFFNQDLTNALKNFVPCNNLLEDIVQN